MRDAPSFAVEEHSELAIAPAGIGLTQRADPCLKGGRRLRLSHALGAAGPAVVLQTLRPTRIVPPPPPIEGLPADIEVSASLGDVAPVLVVIVYPAEPAACLGGELGGYVQVPGLRQDRFLDVHGASVAPADRLEVASVEPQL
jgi:hypothetical protein